MPALRAAVFYGLQRAYGPRPSGLCPLGTPTLAAEGSGCRGKSAPAPTHGGWGRSRRVKGPSPRPCGAAGRTNPLTRLPLENAPQGHWRASEWKGVKAREATAEGGLALTPWNDPNAQPGGWGSASPPQLPRPRWRERVSKGQRPLGKA